MRNDIGKEKLQKFIRYGTETQLNRNGNSERKLRTETQLNRGLTKKTKSFTIAFVIFETLLCVKD